MGELSDVRYYSFRVQHDCKISAGNLTESSWSAHIIKYEWVTRSIPCQFSREYTTHLCQKYLHKIKKICRQNGWPHLSLEHTERERGLKRAFLCKQNLWWINQHKKQVYEWHWLSVRFWWSSAKTTWWMPFCDCCIDRKLGNLTFFPQVGYWSASTLGILTASR